MKTLQNPIITGVILLSLLLVYDHHHRHLAAAAASGGRMVGSSFRSPSKSSGIRSRTSTPSYYRIPVSSDSKSCSTQIRNPTRRVFEVNFDLFNCCIIIITILSILWLLGLYVDGDHVETSVLMLQVGLSGSVKSLQKDLNQIAEKADTSNPKGFRYMLQETILSVLQHRDYFISGYSSVEVKKGVKECEKQFNKLSIEERSKFDEETLVNFNNIRKQSATSHDVISNGVSNQYIVVTIIVAASGVHELPLIESSELLKIALHKLGSIHSNNVLAAEVLWTPQKEDDFLIEQQMVENYPLLHLL